MAKLFCFHFMLANNFLHRIFCFYSFSSSVLFFSVVDVTTISFNFFHLSSPSLSFIHFVSSYFFFDFSWAAAFRCHWLCVLLVPNFFFVDRKDEKIIKKFDLKRMSIMAISLTAEFSSCSSQFLSFSALSSVRRFPLSLRVVCETDAECSMVRAHQLECVTCSKNLFSIVIWWRVLTSSDRSEMQQLERRATDLKKKHEIFQVLITRWNGVEVKCFAANEMQNEMNEE